MEAIALVEHDVEDDGYSVLVADVDEVLVVFGRAVSFVGREVEVGVVAPRVVACKFHDGHQFDGVYSEFLKVGNLFDCLAYGTVALCLAFGAGEVAEKHLVDEELAVFGNFKVTPFIFVHVTPINGELFGIRYSSGPPRHGASPYAFDGGVVVSVKDELPVGVGYTNIVVDYIIVGVFGVGVEGGDGNPEIVVAFVCMAVHDALFLELVVVPCADNLYALLQRGGQTEGHGAVGVGNGAHLGCAAGIFGLFGSRENGI